MDKMIWCGDSLPITVPPPPGLGPWLLPCPQVQLPGRPYQLIHTGPASAPGEQNALACGWAWPRPSCLALSSGPSFGQVPRLTPDYACPLVPGAWELWGVPISQG